MFCSVFKSLILVSLNRVETFQLLYIEKLICILLDSSNGNTLFFSLHKILFCKFSYCRVGILIVDVFSFAVLCCKFSYIEKCLVTVAFCKFSYINVENLGYIVAYMY